MSLAVPASANREEKPAGLVRALSLQDAVLLVIGGVIGSGIFTNSADVAAALPAPVLFLGIWIVGGGICYLAAVAVGELGAMYPEAGGQYVYLREGFGDLVGFLYGWMMFVAGGSGGIATIAVAFADYLGKAAPVLAADAPLWTIGGWTWRAGHLTPTAWHLTRGDLSAIACIVVLTWINIIGVKRAAILQNITTWLKYVAIAAFVVAAFAFGRGTVAHFHVGGARQALQGGVYPFLSAAGVAFIAVFWSYDGWIYAAWVGGEIREPGRNIARSILIGLAAIIALYVVMNATYLYALPISEIAKHTTVAEVAASSLFSPSAAKWISLLIALVCFGALIGNIMASARVVFAVAEDGLFFRRMGHVHPKYRTPAVALVAQGVLACVIAMTGTFDQLFTYTVFGMTLSYVACVVALFVLRRTQPERPRPYRCWGYPWAPGLYVVLIGGWLINTVVERPVEAVSCLALLAVGLPGYWWWKRHRVLA